MLRTYAFLVRTLSQKTRTNGATRVVVFSAEKMLKTLRFSPRFVKPCAKKIWTACRIPLGPFVYNV